jgi:response regulator RpfG family c-di-GMP phosphodiesterase
MGGKIAGLVCREASVLSVLKWILGEFQQIGAIRQFESAKSLQKALGSEPIDILLLDADAVPESISQVMREIHDATPSLRTILIISPTAKDEIMKIIGANLVKGIVVKPFTKDAVSRYVEKLVH